MYDGVCQKPRAAMRCSSKRESVSEKKIRSLTSVSFARIICWVCELRVSTTLRVHSLARTHIGPRVFNFTKKGIYRDDNDNLKRASKREFGTDRVPVGLSIAVGAVHAECYHKFSG